jgi:hypothetical protein
MSKSLKKGSKAAKAWGAKMRRLRGGKRKTTTRRRRTTRKGMLTLRRKRAYSGKRKSNKPRKRSKSRMSWTSKLKSGTVGKILIGLGAAQAAALVVGMVAPQIAPIAKPVAALAAGGIPGVAAELVLDQGLLGSMMGMFGGGGINETRLAGGL